MLLTMSVCLLIAAVAGERLVTTGEQYSTVQYSTVQYSTVTGEGLVTTGEQELQCSNQLISIRYW